MILQLRIPKKKNNITKLAVIKDKIEELNKDFSDKNIDYTIQQNKIKCLKGGLDVLGNEIEICKQFFSDILTIHED